MKSIRWASGILAIVAAGCAGTQQSCSHFKSSLVGLPRVVTLYAQDGAVIRTWEGWYQVIVDGSSARFIDQGKVVTISGTWIIEER
mgnify:CR=1 FL=1